MLLSFNFDVAERLPEKYILRTYSVKNYCVRKELLSDEGKYCERENKVHNKYTQEYQHIYLTAIQTVTADYKRNYKCNE